MSLDINKPHKLNPEGRYIVGSIYNKVEKKIRY